MNIKELTELFSLGRPITSLNKNNKYLYFAYKYKFSNYRLISSGELIVRGKNLNIPNYVKQFISVYREVLMIANIFNGKVISIIFRTISGSKEFIKLGYSKSLFYGLGDLSEDFKYGDALLLVEGNLDRDRMSLMYKNTLALTTSSISKTQLQLLSGLTNNFILMLDNDEAGIKGSKLSYYKLKDIGKVNFIEHEPHLKDAGDLIDLEIRNDSRLDFIENYYRIQILNFA